MLAVLAKKRSKVVGLFLVSGGCRWSSARGAACRITQRASFANLAARRCPPEFPREVPAIRQRPPPGMAGRVGRRRLVLPQLPLRPLRARVDMDRTGRLLRLRPAGAHRREGLTRRRGVRLTTHRNTLRHRGPLLVAAGALRPARPSRGPRPVMDPPPDRALAGPPTSTTVLPPAPTTSPHSAPQRPRTLTTPHPVGRPQA
jgi:hypothetical protein